MQIHKIINIEFDFSQDFQQQVILYSLPYIV